MILRNNIEKIIKEFGKKETMMMLCQSHNKKTKHQKTEKIKKRGIGKETIPKAEDLRLMRKNTNQSE